MSTSEDGSDGEQPDAIEGVSTLGSAECLRRDVLADDAVNKVGWLASSANPSA